MSDLTKTNDPREPDETSGHAVSDEPRTPGDQERPMDDEEELDHALDETFPASDPIAPSRIDGPGN